MFNKKLKKKIEELERQVEELLDFKKNFPEFKKAKPDTKTRNLHLESDMVCIKGEKMIKKYDWWGNSIELRESKDFYFLKGTEPKCNFIKEDIEGNLSYYKNNVECDMGGKLKK